MRFRLPKVLRPVRRLVAAMQGLKDAVMSLTLTLTELRLAQEATGPATARLDALELSRHKWEAMCEGLLQKAEGKLGAARNAEARERANKRSYEHLLDPLAEDGEPTEAEAGHPDSSDHATPGETEGVPPLRLDVAPTDKALAVRAKFGVS